MPRGHSENPHKYGVFSTVVITVSPDFIRRRSIQKEPEQTPRASAPVPSRATASSPSCDGRGMDLQDPRRGAASVGSGRAPAPAKLVGEARHACGGDPQNAEHRLPVVPVVLGVLPCPLQVIL